MIFKQIKTTILIVLVSSLATYAQNLKYVKSSVIQYKGKTLKKPDEMLTILKTRESEPLIQSFNKYKSNRTGATIFSAIGGFGIGWSLGELINKGSVNTGFLLGGAGALGIGLIFNSASNKHLREAVNLYNNHPDQVSFGVGFTKDGAGLSVKF